MADTRMKVASNATIYFRIGASGEAQPAVDVGSKDANHSGLGSSVDLLLKSGDSDQTTVTHNCVVSASETGAISAITGTPSDTAFTDGFLFIKHSGYKEALKTNATTHYLKIGVGSAVADNKWISLQPQETWLIHSPLGTSTDSTANIFLQSSTDNIYVEIISGN